MVVAAQASFGSAYGHRGAKRHASGGSTQVRRPAGIAVSLPWRTPSPSSCGQRAEQRLGVRVLRMVEQLLRRRVLDDLAGVHHRDVVGGLGDDAHVVGDDDHRHARARSRSSSSRSRMPRLHGDVERRRRLVRDQELRVAGERDRDHHALPHAAGVAGAGSRRAARRAFGMCTSSSSSTARLRASSAREAEVALHASRRAGPDRQRRVERRHRILEDHRDLRGRGRPRSSRCEQLVRSRPSKRIAPPTIRRGRSEQAHDRERGDGLPAAGLADDAERLASLDREADAVDGAHVAGTGLEVRLRFSTSRSAISRTPGCAGRARREGRRR